MNDDDDIIFVKVFKFKNHFEIDAKYAYDLNTFLSAVPGSCKTQNLLNFSWAIPNEYLDTVYEYIRNHKQYRLRINEIKNTAYLFYFKNYICIKCDFDKYDVSEFEFEFLLAAAPLPEGKNEWLVPSIYYDYLKQFFQKLHIIKSMLTVIAWVLSLI